MCLNVTQRFPVATGLQVDLGFVERTVDPYFCFMHMPLWLVRLSLKDEMYARHVS